MLETIILGIIVLLFLWWLTQPNARFKKFGDAIPGPRPYPYFGDMLTAPLTGPNALDKHVALARKYNGTYRLYMGNILSVVVSSPEDIEAVLTSNSLINKAFTYEFLQSWLGTGLLTSTGEKWHARRKIITPTFHFKILDKFINVFNKHTDVLIKRLEKHCSQESFDVEMLLKRCTLDIICETAMGIETDEKSSVIVDYIKSVERIIQILSDRLTKPWLFSPITYALSGRYFIERKLLKTLKLFIDEVINMKQSDEADTKSSSEDFDDFGIKKKTAFLEMLLNIKSQPNTIIATDKDIMEEVNTFMFAGHDTSVSTLCYSLYLLAVNPKIQDMLYEDLIKTFHSKDKNFTREDLNEMKFLERVIKETLRLYPTVPFIGRNANEDIKLPSGYVIPKDAMVIVNIAYSHKNEKQYENPDVFNPDNFLPENVAQRHPFSFIPFSAGPRNCMGQRFALLEIKTILAKIVLNYKIEPANGNFKPMPDVKMVLHSCTGHKLRISKREM
ncbi:cytochrome P450 4C1-like isoform X2 [Cimex lectularius]|uniref:Cytochrome P450 n=1 Tax=Cimex lectularius TaxID=79782 RepID=A0A8I6RPA9_CIMLE|nr:cytochrome P450 4C1-like isoform X2 [Cimex lectularius]